jgi:predicted ATP-grasp superfamily ATP-dependent carboligase
MNIFVTDGNQRSALAVTRSLGRRGFSVVVGEAREGSLAAASRFCARSVVYPSPYDDPDGFERFVARLVVHERLDVVIPVSDVTTHAIARNQDALRIHTALAVPPFDAFERLTDKASLMNRAAKCGIPIPTTHVVEGISALRGVQDRVSFPAVVKSTRSRMRTADGWIGGGVHYASNVNALKKLYRETDYLASYPSLIQEQVLGRGVGVFALCDRGRVRTMFQHVRLRERPPSGGVSVLSESLPVDQRLREQATRLLEPLGWHGVAMLEYKQDQRTGTQVLIEVNGRFWGSLQLAVDAGVDFPYLSCQLALGRRVEAPTQYTVGQRNRWWIGDLDNLLLQVLGRDHAGNGAAAKLRAAMNFARATKPGIRNEVARLDDPMPACRELVGYASELAQAAGRRIWRPIARAGAAALPLRHER